MSSNKPNDEWGGFFEGVTGQPQKSSPPIQPNSAVPPASASAQRAGSTTRCTKCGATNDISQKFCGTCGTALQPPPAPQPATIFCGKCGAQNDASKKFCGACGAPLQASSSRLYTSPASAATGASNAAMGALARTSTGYKVASPGAVIAILCFFLPWLFVSCGGSSGYSFTGIELAFGKQIEQFAGAVQQTDPAPLLILVLLAAIAVPVLAWMAIRRGRLTMIDGIGVIGLGAGALVLIVIQGLVYSSAMQSQGASQYMQWTVEVGLFGVLIGYLAVIAGGILNARRKP